MRSFRRTRYEELEKRDVLTSAWLAVSEPEVAYSTLNSILASRFVDLNADGVHELIVVEGYSPPREARRLELVLLGNVGGDYEIAGRWPVSSSDFELVDFDSDGVLDVVRQDGDSVVVEFLQVDNSNWTLRESRQFLVGFPNLSRVDLHLADLNNDGLVELVAVDPTAGSVDVFQGTSAGFVNAVRYSGTHVSLADINGDELLDMVMATDHETAEVHVRLNQGDGIFADPGPAVDYAGLGVIMDLYDFNGDGALDLVLSHLDVEVWFGNGDGTFRDREVLRTLTGSVAANTHERSAPVGIELEDIDGDGFADVVVGAEDFVHFGSVPQRVAYSDGNGGFDIQSASVSRLFGRGFFHSAVNLDHTGPAELVRNRDGVVEVLNQIQVKDFEIETTSVRPDGENRFHYVEDINGDGMRDVVRVNEYADGVVVEILERTGDGFVTSEVNVGRMPLDAVEIFQIEGTDSWAFFLTGSRNAETTTAALVHQEDGTWHVGDMTVLPLEGPLHGINVEDLVSDGTTHIGVQSSAASVHCTVNAILDLSCSRVANSGGRYVDLDGDLRSEFVTLTAVYSNQEGDWTAAQKPFVFGELVDFNADGRLDLLYEIDCGHEQHRSNEYCGGFEDQDRLLIYEFTGTGWEDASASHPPIARAASFDYYHMNNDSFLDLVVRAGTETTVYLGDGNYAWHRVYSVAGRADVRDLDGVNGMDLVLDLDGLLHLELNDGNGRFRPVPIVGDAPVSSAHFTDMDSDGVVEVLSQTPQSYDIFDLGAGGLRHVQNISKHPTEIGRDAHLGDASGDGISDIVLGANMRPGNENGGFGDLMPRALAQPEHVGVSTSLAYGYDNLGNVQTSVTTRRPDGSVDQVTYLFDFAGDTIVADVTNDGEEDVVVFGSETVRVLRKLNRGDFNEDGMASQADLESLYMAMGKSGEEALRYDMNQDASVDFADVDFWISHSAKTVAGDVNTDGLVDFEDFLDLSRNFGTRIEMTWLNGDFDHDGEVGFNDFLALSSEFGFTREQNSSPNRR